MANGHTDIPMMRRLDFLLSSEEAFQEFWSYMTNRFFNLKDETTREMLENVFNLPALRMYMRPIQELWVDTPLQKFFDTKALDACHPDNDIDSTDASKTKRPDEEESIKNKNEPLELGTQLWK